GSMHNLASANWLLADHEEAERLYRETLERRVESLGAEHPETLFTSHVLARLLAETGQPAEAEQLYRGTLDAYLRTQGPNHRAALEIGRDLGRLQCHSGNAGEGEALVAEALGRARASLPDEALLGGELATEHGICLSALERWKEAEAALSVAVAQLAGAGLSDPEPLERARGALGELRRARGSE
ncbi:MAG TPA: tetratricopeptide repeat protein, partial [Thermoanaerobaculia bacterium]|nr:tetratricopeptide repeat protein [Thermoanaerobaculia bacterium]